MALQVSCFCIVFVNSLVSIPEIPGTSFSTSHSLKLFLERQLDGFVGCCLTMIPAIDLVLLSLSKLFVPILPICGKVKVII